MVPLRDVPPVPIGADALDELLRTFWDSPFPVLVQDAGHRMVAVNDAFVAFAGRSRGLLLGLDPAALMAPDDRALHLATRDLGRAGHEDGLQQRLVERRLIDGQGHERWYRAARSELDDGHGRRHFVSVLQDTTAEHHAREQVDRSLRELEQWFALSPVGMVMFDGHGLIVRSNQAFEALVGEVPVALPDGEAGLRELLGWDAAGPHDELTPEAPPLERSAGIVATDGRRRQLVARVRAIEPAPGQRRFLAVVQDRSAEDERDLARLEMGALMDTAGVGVATFEASTGWRQSAPARPAAPAAAGGGLQSISRELIDPGSLADYERLQKAMRSGERAEVRYAVRHPDLGLRWLLTRVEPGQLSSGRPTTSVVTLDVTEHEQARFRNEQLLRELTTILDGTSAGIAYLRGNLLVRCNQRFERMLGLSGGRAAGATLEEVFAGHDSLKPVVQNSLAALRSAAVFETEFRLESSGAWYSLSVRRAAGGADGETVAVLTDISRLKSQQGELENLLRERELMSSLSDVGIAWMRGGRIERANEAFATLTGYAPAELARLDPADLYEDRAAWLRAGRDEGAALEADGRFAAERRLKRRDGGLLWVQVHQRLIDEADSSAGLIGSYVDVDERHRVRQSLQRQAERTRAILDSVLVGIVTVDEDGIEWMNRSARRMFGGELADFVGQPIATVATPDPDHPLRRTHYLEALAEGQAEAFECQLQARDGREFWVVGNVVLTGREAAGGGRQLTFALLDIERRRQAEAAQRAAEEARFEAALAQREMLVKEVHHRIKNNLQGVAGLMQQIARRKPEVAPVIAEAVGQVHAIAQVYGLQVGVSGPLRVGSLLEAIVGSVQRMFGRTIVLALDAAGDPPAPPADPPDGTAAPPADAADATGAWALPEAESIPIALTLNELLTNALKHSPESDGADVRCELVSSVAQVQVRIVNRGWLPEGFDLAAVPGGVSGLGLVRALLPRRTATLALVQHGVEVVATVTLTPPGVRRA